jgi:hypothetical protein
MKNPTPSRPPNTHQTFAANYREYRQDLDMAPRQGPVMRTAEVTSLPGHSINAATVHMRHSGGTFVSVEIQAGVIGMFFLLTGEGAREYAKALNACADEADAALAAEAARQLAEIINRQGGSANG